MSRPYISVAERKFVIDRAHNRCEYCVCRADFATETFPVDHITPISLGGSNDINNLALACSGCNGRKSNRTSFFDPIDGKLVPLFNPRQQQWEIHFSWNEDFTEMIGLTRRGRATIVALELNRKGVVNIRKALLAIGKHPPHLAVD